MRLSFLEVHYQVNLGGGFGGTASTAPTGPGAANGGSPTVDPAFQATVLAQLQAQLGSAFSNLTTAQVSQIVQSAWLNPLYQQDWQANQTAALAQGIDAQIQQVVTQTPVVAPANLGDALTTAVSQGGTSASGAAAPSATTNVSSVALAEAQAFPGIPAEVLQRQGLLAAGDVTAYNQLSQAGSASQALANLQGTTFWSSLSPDKQASVAAIADVAGQYAAKYGVDPTQLFQMGVAAALQESGLNTMSDTGDGGHSIGLFNLDDAGGEGSGMTVAQREDPMTNALVAMNVIAQKMVEFPGANPAGIIALAQRPAGVLSTMTPDQAASTTAGQEYAGMVNIVSGGTYVAGGSSPSPEQAAAGIYDPALDPINTGIVSDWVSYYGRDPSTAELENVLSNSSDYASADQYIRNLASPSIAGMNNGQVTDNKAALDKEMQSMFGHNSTLGMVQEFFNNGWMSPAAMRLQLEDMSQMGIDPATYNTIYAAIQPAQMAITGDPGTDPRTIAAIAASAGVPAVAAPTQVSQAADALPVMRNEVSGMPGEQGGNSLAPLEQAIERLPSEAVNEGKKIAQGVGGWIGSRL